MPKFRRTKSLELIPGLLDEKYLNSLRCSFKKAVIIYCLGLMKNYLKQHEITFSHTFLPLYAWTQNLNREKILETDLSSNNPAEFMPSLLEFLNVFAPIVADITINTPGTSTDLIAKLLQELNYLVVVFITKPAVAKFKKGRERVEGSGVLGGIEYPSLYLRIQKNKLPTMFVYLEGLTYASIKDLFPPFSDKIFQVSYNNDLLLFLLDIISINIKLNNNEKQLQPELNAKLTENCERIFYELKHRLAQLKNNPLPLNSEEQVINLNEILSPYKKPCLHFLIKYWQCPSTYSVNSLPEDTRKEVTSKFKQAFEKKFKQSSLIGIESESKLVEPLLQSYFDEITTMSKSPLLWFDGLNLPNSIKAYYRCCANYEEIFLLSPSDMLMQIIYMLTLQPNFAKPIIIFHRLDAKIIATIIEFIQPFEENIKVILLYQFSKGNLIDPSPHMPIESIISLKDLKLESLDSPDKNTLYVYDTNSVNIQISTRKYPLPPDYLDIDIGISKQSDYPVLWNFLVRIGSALALYGIQCYIITATKKNDIIDKILHYLSALDLSLKTRVISYTEFLQQPDTINVSHDSVYLLDYDIIAETIPTTQSILIEKLKPMIEVSKVVTFQAASPDHPDNLPTEINTLVTCSFHKDEFFDRKLLELVKAIYMATVNDIERKKIL
ncbi:MAG: hypothetical protein AAGG80_02170, partial [Pseudomonadota bacterium]